MSWARGFRSGASLLLVGCAGAASGPRPAATPPAAATVSVPAAPSAAATAPADVPASPERVFRDNLARAQAASERAGWVLSRRIDVEGHHAALLVYDPVPERAGAALSQHFDAVGARPGAVPVSGDSGMIDVSRTADGSLLWNLRGDGARFVIVELTPCGANCQIPEPRVLELDAGDGLAAASSAPACPTCISDQDADGIPEFDVALASLEVGGCPRVACGPIYALRIDVEGYESWDGAAFARNLASFKPLYERKLDDARVAAKALATSPNKSAVCPDDALRAAGGLYVYGVLLGERPADAIKHADAAMAGYTTKPCQARFDMFDAPKPWSALRAALLATSLPTLDGQRHIATRAPTP